MNKTMQSPVVAEEMETRRAPDVLRDLRRGKKAASGSENRQRTKAVRVRLHPADLERLKTEAAAVEMSVAGYLASGRLGAETAPRPRLRRRHVPVDVTALLQACVDFRRANSLLNQEAHAQNTLALFAEEQDVVEVLDELRDLRRTNDRLREQFAAALAAIHAALGDDSEG
jgi:hypothetical protein